MVSNALWFWAGWLAYHLLMNRTLMMRRCCVEHFENHKTCPCRDCAAEREWPRRG